MTQVNTYQAKTQLSQLIQKSLDGQEVVIAKAGKPLVKLIPFEPKQTPRKPGALKGKIWIANDFDELPEDLIKAFYEGPIEPTD